MYSVKKSWGKKADTWSKNVQIQNTVGALVGLLSFAIFKKYLFLSKIKDLSGFVILRTQKIIS